MTIEKRHAKKMWHGRAFALSMVALWMSFFTIVGGGVLDACGLLSQQYVDLATGFAWVFVAAVGGSHATNAADRFKGNGSQLGGAD